MRIKLVDPNRLPFHPTLRHPVNGGRLRALLRLPNGSFIYPIAGSDGEEDKGKKGEGGEGGEGDKGEKKKEEEGSEGGEGQGSDTDKDKTVPKAELEKLQASFDALKNQLSASDKNKSKAEKELEEIKRKERSELENTQKDLETEKESHGKLKTAFNSLALTNAFLIASAQEKIQWHNPKVAQKAADLDGLEINSETGEVTGIRDAVKKLAKDQAFLVNKNGEEEEGTGKRGASGSGVGSGSNSGKGTKGKLSNDELTRRFPALRR